MTVRSTMRMASKKLVLVLLAGFVAGGVGVGVAGATRSVAGGPLAAEPPCSLARGLGEAVKWKSKLLVGSDIVDRKLLRPGTAIATTGRGKAQFCLTTGRWRCTMYRKTRVIIAPKGTNLVLRLLRGDVECSVVGTNETQKLEAAKSSLTMDGQIVPPPPFAFANSTSAHRATSAGGKLLVLSTHNGRTIVKVRRGAVVLARKATSERAVVVAKGEQAAAVGAREPQRPTPIQLTAAQRASLGRLARGLPKETDTKGPAVGIPSGPRSPSSIRRATFTLAADESAIFSCALDGDDYRLCQSSHTVTGVKPGTHTLSVRATDAAGNTQTERQTWTVDASRIVFASHRDGNPEIYRVDPDGSAELRLTTDVAPLPLQSDENPSWGPRHERLVFDKLKQRNQDIYAINADGTGETRLTTHPASDRNPAWSPDGTKIAFESYRDGNRELYVMNADGTGVVRLTNHPAEDLDPSWAPDSLRIVFASSRSGSYDLYVMSLGGTPQQLTDDPFADIGPSWSPDGARIAFHSNRTLTSNEIFVMNVDGSGVAQITKNEQPDENPDWAPDGVHIVFQSRRGGSDQLIILNVDTGEELELTKPNRDLVPDW